jgi:hypothetical protein
MASRLDAPLIIGRWFQGPTGQGHGGWAAAKLAERIGEPMTVWFRAPIPLDEEMTIVESVAGWECRHDDRVVMDARPSTLVDLDTAVVSIDEAVQARARFLFGADDHPVPYCFSCGVQPDGMGVRAGPLSERGATHDGDERFATDWTAPAWAVADDGTVDPAVLWAALDCTCAFYVTCHPRIRLAVTASISVEIVRPVAPDETLALVGWRGDWEGEWDGRKRGAASTAFDADGRTVARARSLWIALD